MSFVGVFVGLIVSFVTVLVGSSVIVGFMVGSPAVEFISGINAELTESEIDSAFEAMEQDMDRVFESMSFLLALLLFGLFSTAAGAFVAAKIGKLAPYKNAIAFSVVSIGLGVLMVDSSSPLWFDIVANSLVLPVALLAAYTAKPAEVEVRPVRFSRRKGS